MGGERKTAESAPDLIADRSGTASFEQASAAYCFGPFRLEPESGLLLRGEQPVSVTPKVFDALVYLVERSGKLLTKDELIRELWSDAVVSEANLTQTIFMLRKALNENGQRYIATVPGRGYRFEAEVRRASSNSPTLAPIEPAESAMEDGPLAAVEPALVRAGWQRRWIAAAALALVAIVAGGGWFAWWRAQPSRHPAGRRVMLAVLPFQNLTGDPSQEYFSDGLTEEMISLLGMIDPSRLGVIARTSVMHYKNQQLPLDRVGRELGVRYVLEGSVRRDGDHVRVTAQLIQTSDQTHLWAREYDRELRGLLALQQEVAQEIADQTELSLGAKKPLSAPASLPRDDAAYEAYLKGEYHFNKRTVHDFHEAIAYFEEAAAEDPNYARAYAGIADTYALIAGYSARPQREFIAKARAAVLKALAIDPNLPEAHAALALIVQNYDWDWATAEKEFRRAIDLNPNYATAHQWYAEHLMWRGRFDEALAESERARQLDPLSLIIATDNGAILYYSRQYDRAIAEWRSVLEMDPSFPRAHLIRLAYAQKGMSAEALADVTALGEMPNEPRYWCYLAVIYGRSGDKAQGLHALHELLQLSQRIDFDPQVIADAYAALGNKDEAMAWLERAYAQHCDGLVSLGVEPLYDVLRGDPRFAAMVRKVGL